MAKEIKPIVPTDISAMGAVVGILMSDLRQIIDEARIHVASTANYELTMMYWHIGERINRDVLGFLEFTGLKGLYSEKDLLQKLNGKMKERRMRYE